MVNRPSKFQANTRGRIRKQLTLSPSPSAKKAVNPSERETQVGRRKDCRLNSIRRADDRLSVLELFKWKLEPVWNLIRPHQPPGPDQATRLLRLLCLPALRLPAAGEPTSPREYVER